LDYRCLADRRSLIADKKFLLACSSFGVTGFQFSSDKVLPHLRKWETGTAVGMNFFGRGYCYLRMFREGFRMRVARILGPVAYLADVCLLYRLAGLSNMAVKFRFVGPGLVHCEEDDVKNVRSGRDVYAEVLGLLELCGDARVGSEFGVGSYSQDSSVLAIPGLKTGGISMSGGDVVRSEHGVAGKVYCAECTFNVNPSGHAKRCRKVRHRDPVAELVGDALHSLDVKALVVSMFPVGTHYTEIVKRYMVSSSQRWYLLEVRPDLKNQPHSDHTYANVFESMYHGEFRVNYLCWLKRDLEANGGEDVYSRGVDVLKFLRGFDDDDVGLSGWVICVHWVIWLVVGVLVCVGIS